MTPDDWKAGAPPADGSVVHVRIMVTETYRWKRYKPDGARQMGKPGRWQKMVGHGDFHDWQNCEPPKDGEWQSAERKS